MKKVVHFAPESVVHIRPESVVHFRPESVVHFHRNTHKTSLPLAGRAIYPPPFRVYYHTFVLEME